jgi:hypothetical protein
LLTTGVALTTSQWYWFKSLANIEAA